MQCGLTVVAYPFEDLLVGLHVRARAELAGAHLSHGFGVQQRTRNAHCLDPLAAILVGLQVVEEDLRLFVDVCALDADVALGIGKHRANVPLETVLDVGLLAVVAHCHRQEVEHQVRVFLVLVGTNESAALEVGGRNRALLGENPLQAHEWPAPLVQVRLGGIGGLGGLILDVDLEVILQVLADAWQVLDDVDSVLAQQLLVTDTRDLQQLRGVDGTSGKNDLVSEYAVDAALPLVFHADGLLAFEEDLGGKRAGTHLEVLAVQVRVQVSARCRPALAVLDVAVERREAFLAVTVDVVGQVVAGFLDGLKQSLEQRAGGGAAGEVQRAVMAAARIVVLGCGGVLHAVEVRQAVGKVPVLHAGVLGPLLIIHRVAALVDHAVDGRGTAEQLAARVVDASVIHLWLRLGLVLPVVVLCANGE